MRGFFRGHHLSTTLCLALLVMSFVAGFFENHVHDRPTDSVVVDGTCDPAGALHLCSVPKRRSITPCLACLPHPKEVALPVSSIRLFAPKSSQAADLPALDLALAEADSSATPVRGPPIV